MKVVCCLIWLALIGLFRSRASLQAEILTLRHQLNVLRRKSPQRLTFSSIDRLVFAGSPLPCYGSDNCPHDRKSWDRVFHFLLRLESKQVQNPREEPPPKNREASP